MYKKIVDYIKQCFGNTIQIPLHVPSFVGNEKKYLNECIDTTFVSSVGKFVNRFEEMTAEYTGAKKAVVCVNGTEALHMALILSGTSIGDEVITQPITFIATANAISYTGAKPIFVDVDLDTMGLSPEKVKGFLEEYGEIRDDGNCYNRESGHRISACVPMHTFGHPCKIEELAKICKQYNITLIEDAAESLGSFYKNKHTGTFGRIGILSYNGNKTVTTGGGGMLITNDEKLGILAKHLTTQAKIPHRWEYSHDHIGYNYRMPNINAALGVAQMEYLEKMIDSKRELAKSYIEYFSKIGVNCFTEPSNSRSNYWLNAIILENQKQRDDFLEYSNNNGVMTRPIWNLMNELPMFSNCQTYKIENAEWLVQRVVNIPSSARM